VAGEVPVPVRGAAVDRSITLLRQDTSGPDFHCL